MICPYPPCQKEFTPKRPHQRFCSNGCRVNDHAGSDGGLRGAVTAVRKCKGDAVSVTLRFPATDAAKALALSPSDIVEILSGSRIVRDGDALEQRAHGERGVMQ